MTVSLKAVHCISGRKKVFPQTFLSELSWVISKCKDFSFCKYVKKIFFRAQNNHSPKKHKFQCCKDRKLPKLRSSLLKDHLNATKKCYDPYIKWSFKGKKCTLLLIYFVLRDPENLFVTTRYMTFWKPAKIACLRCRLFPKSRPGRSKLQLNSAKQRLGSIEM